MIKAVSHYVQRARQLGVSGSVRQASTRIADATSVWSQSVWWGWKARRELSDSALLARTTGSWQSVEEFLAHLQSRPGSSFMFPHESPEETRAHLNKHCPEYLAAVMQSANASCRNELELLGHTFHSPEGIDWQKDPVTGWRWPVLHRSRIVEQLGSKRPVDLIVFWEMNRHQHFISLGIAYWLTGDERYTEAFCAQVENWIKSNPLQHGVNWHYGLEVSIRLMAWTAAFQFFRGSRLFMERSAKSFLKSLWQQADFLSHHLQLQRAPGVASNNHLMAELVGLTVVGASFPEFRSANSWSSRSLEYLNEQVVKQTFADGVHKELALGYHRFIAELLLIVIARSRQGALPPVPVVEGVVERMIEYMYFCVTPTGTSPMWGDTDFGRALGMGLSRDFWDIRPLLVRGAALFQRSDWKFVAEQFDAETLWMLGADGLKVWETLQAEPPPSLSHGFEQAGQYVIRDSWSQQSDVAFFRCGPFGLGGVGQCAHAHCDLLSVMLWMDGQPVLVDSGTYMYHGPLRDHFRLTGAHNTVMVNGQEQGIPLPNFNWSSIPNARCVSWNGHEVTGAMDCAGDVTLTRTLSHPATGHWEVVDTFAPTANTKATWFFNFAPGLELRRGPQENTLTVLQDGAPFVIVNLPAGISVEFRDSWYSSQYRVKEKCQCLVARWDAVSPEPFRWVFRLAKDGRSTGAAARDEA